MRRTILAIGALACVAALATTALAQTAPRRDPSRCREC